MPRLGLATYTVCKSMQAMRDAGVKTVIARVYDANEKSFGCLKKVAGITDCDYNAQAETDASFQDYFMVTLSFK